MDKISKKKAGPVTLGVFWLENAPTCVLGYSTEPFACFQYLIFKPQLHFPKNYLFPRCAVWIQNHTTQRADKRSVLKVGSCVLNECPKPTLKLSFQSLVLPKLRAGPIDSFR